MKETVLLHMYGDRCEEATLVAHVETQGRTHAQIRAAALKTICEGAARNVCTVTMRQQNQTIELR